MQELKEFQILKRQMSQTDPAIINSVNYSTFNGSISGLIKFSKNLYINGQQDTDFFNIHSAFQQILQSSVNSLQTFPKDFNTLLITKRQRDIDTLDKNARQAIANYISNLMI